MFKISDFWKILKVIRGEGSTVTNLSEQVRAVSRSEQGVASKLFSSILDQNVFMSNDYRKFRNFLIDFYASHRTLTTIQSQATDPLSIPETHLDELFRSFGYDWPVVLSRFDEIPNVNKVNFFLDLVNLYKIKGTPQVFVELLQYHALTKIDVIEYSLLRDSHYNLVFRGSIAASSSPIGPSILIPDLDFNTVTIPDPHWLLTKSNVEQLLLTNKINFPSKSPYFSIRCRGFGLTDMEIEIMILSREVHDQYDEWVSTGAIVKQDAFLSKFIGYTISLLELYLSCIYVFNYNYTVGADDTNFLCYDSTAEATISEIDTEYKTVISQPTTQDERDSGLITYYDSFTRKRSESFLQNRESAGEILDQINPTLRQDLASLIEFNELLPSLLWDLARWVRLNIGPGYPNIAYFVLGEIAHEIGDVINFFKPYRARFLSVDIIRIIDNPLHDSIIVKELPVEYQLNYPIHDFVTADSDPCCISPILDCSDSTADLKYSREYYDCGSYYDIGSCIDIVRIYVWDSTSEIDISQFAPTPDASDPDVEVVTVDFISSSSSSSESSSSSSSESSSSSSESSSSSSESSSSSSESSSSSSESSSSSSESSSSSSESSSSSSSSESSSSSSESSSSSSESSSSSSSSESSSSSSSSESSSSSSESSSSSSESSSSSSSSESSSSESSSSSSSSESSSSSSSSESSSSSSESSSSSSESSSSSSESSSSSSSSESSSSSSSSESSSSSSSSESSSSSSSSESSSSSSSSESSSSSSESSSSSSSSESSSSSSSSESSSSSSLS